jgi:hypothetical protein
MGESMAENELQQAIAALKAGEKARGRSMLVRIIQQQPKNELAWLWLYDFVDSDEQRRDCLKKVVGINPANQNAQQALNSLTPHIEAPMVEVIAPNEKPVPEIPEQQVSSTVPMISGQVRQEQESSPIPTILFLGLVLIIIAALVIILVSLLKNITPVTISSVLTINTPASFGASHF